VSPSEQPVCWGRRHSFKVDRLPAGTLSVAEFLDDDAVAFARCVSPTPAEWTEWLAHAWQAGQNYEVRQRDEAEAEDEPACPACTGECQCSDVVKEARARFAPDGEGAVQRKNVVTYSSRSFASATKPAGAGTPGVTAAFPGLDTDHGADAASTTDVT